MEHSATQSPTLELLDESSTKTGLVTFYADSRAQRAKADRRQCRERRKTIRFTPDRRGTEDRRRTSMNWNNGYHFTSDLSAPIDMPPT